MDTSKKYIEMCEKAEEIQKEWKPAFNDFACDRDDLFDYPHRIKSVNSCADDEYSGTTDSIHYNRAKDMSFWLPRQDQLQEILDKPKRWADSAFDMLCSIYDFSQDWVGGGAETMGLSDFGEYLEKFSSAEQVWLAFVMSEKYNKMWDGEKWIKGT